jgi:transposase-like protein
LKKRIAEEVVSGLKGVAEVSRDYGISTGTVKKWIQKYRAMILQNKTTEVLPLEPMEKTIDNQKADLEKRVKALEEENMLLRKKLLESNLKTEALKTLIDLAEDTYGLGLRKNSGARQSDK